jgi:glyoxylase-like metal-dependent hydrolase (beta-lactamase superfamily II)
MPEEIVPGLFRLSIPLPNDSLGSVNVYAVASVDGLRLIDSGWNAPEAYGALVDELRGLGMQVVDIKEILVTHNHPDHIGLAERLVQEAGARLLLHRLDAPSEATYAEDREGMLAEMQAWLQINGMPREERETLMGGMRRMTFRLPAYRPDTLLEGGEVLAWQPFRFEVIWTPGHAPGLVCLYEPQAQVLISSDHVLQRISPNIGLYARQSGDPLGEYLRSLQLVRDLPVKLVLPGHGAPFTDLAGRVEALVAHHEQRLQEIVNVLADEEQTAYGIASRLSWRRSERGWQRLLPFDRLAALSETLAHVEYLTNQRQVRRHELDDHVLYQGIR